VGGRCRPLRGLQEAGLEVEVGHIVATMLEHVVFTFVNSQCEEAVILEDLRM
jgi:hypothetical protein